MAGPQARACHHCTLLPSAVPPGAARVRGRRPKGCGIEGLGRGGLGQRWSQAPRGWRVEGPGLPVPLRETRGAPRCGALLPPAGGAEEKVGGRPWGAKPPPLPPAVGTKAAARPRVRHEAPRRGRGGIWDPEARREVHPAAPPPPSAPARKRWRRGGGAGKRFRGRGARAGAAAGAAGTGLAPAAAEGAPRAGDVSAALSAGEARRLGAAGGGRGAGGAGGAGGSPRPLSGSLWARRGGRLRAWSVRRAGGWAGGAGCSRGRAGSGGPGTCSGQALAPESGRRWRGRGSRAASCPGLPSLHPGRLGIPCFRAPCPQGRSPFVRGGRMVECPGEPGRAAGSALPVAATDPLPHATAFLQVNRRRRVLLGSRRLHGHSRPQSVLPLRRAGLGLASGCKQCHSSLGGCALGRH